MDVAGTVSTTVLKLTINLKTAMNKKAWAAKFKKYAVLAGVNEPKKGCHGVRKARAEVAAYADCTESQMMAMFGWTDPKMPAHYIAKANREKLGMSGMDKVVAFDQSHSLDDLTEKPHANGTRTSAENKVVTLRSNSLKKHHNFNGLGVGMVRSEGSQLAAMRLISFMFFDFAESMYPNPYLRLYPGGCTE
jgi:hypothetical protein